METFNFGPRTLEILKNYSAISSGQIFRKGTVLETCSPQGSVFSRASIAETIPFDFSLASLSDFLSINSLYKEVEITEREQTDDKGRKRQTIIVTGDRNFHQTFIPCDVTMIPRHENHFPSVDPKTGEKLPSFIDRVFSPSEVTITFDLPKTTMIKAFNVANIFSCDLVRFTGADGRLILSTGSSKIKTAANEFSVELGDTNVIGAWEYKIENLMILPDDYNIRITPKGLMLMKSADVQYAIAKRKE